MKKTCLLVSLLYLFTSCADESNAGNDIGTATEVAVTPTLQYSVMNIYPHDTTSFTEGLLVHEGQLYESTGGKPGENEFRSWVGPVNLKTGKPLKQVMLDTTYFGEGITILNGKLYQLTWKHKKGFIYDVSTLKKLREFSYHGDGWSLTNDGTSLIMSDGTNNLRYLHPDSLNVLKIMSVQDNNGPVGNINELEFINGFIYANQWQTNYILKIDPSNGRVVGKIDLSSLDNEARIKYPRALELNGIAYDSAARKIYVTGKAWPSLYEVKFD
jgi:glutamine cyclotransferase